jgi:hypothetical protein
MGMPQRSLLVLANRLELVICLLTMIEIEPSGLKQKVFENLFAKRSCWL